MNNSLKKLILPEDDTDTATEVEDKANNNNVAPTFHTPPRIVIPQPIIPSTKSGQTSQTSPVKTGQSSPKQDHAGVVETQPLYAPSSSEQVPNEKKGDLVVAKEPPKLHLLSVLAVLIPHMKYTQQETRKETLRWIIWLHQQLPQRVRGGGKEGGRD